MKIVLPTCRRQKTCRQLAQKKPAARLEVAARRIEPGKRIVRRQPRDAWQIFASPARPAREPGKARPKFFKELRGDGRLMRRAGKGAMPCKRRL